MSRLDTQHKAMGRPRVDSEELRVRMQRPELDALDSYCAKFAVKGRPEAVRRLVRDALQRDTISQRSDTMAERVIITFDVTMEEANLIAEKIAGVGPFYEAWNLPIVLDQLAEMQVPEGKLKRAILRSERSAALGGPNA